MHGNNENIFDSVEFVSQIAISLSVPFIILEFAGYYEH